MAVQEIQKNYVFPRIPLKFLLPDNYPEVGRISNISVIPKIQKFRFSRDELEIRGVYQITVSYFEALAQSDIESSETRELKCDDFFSNVKLHANGLFRDNEEECLSGTGNASRDLYSVQFSRPFHTFIDLQFIGRPRVFKPGLVVEKVNLDKDQGHSIKGELVLGLVNKTRWSYW